jgi:thiol-disulfide isomerase/thioredoxin
MKTKFLTLLSLLLILTCSNTFAQIYKQQINNREGFYRTYHKNPDSAVFFATNLIVDSLGAPYLRQAVHDDMHLVFNGRFREQARKANEEASIKKGKLFNEPEFNAYFNKGVGVIYTTIQKMAGSSNAELAAYAGPIYAWINIQKAEGDQQKITELTEAFIANELTKPDLFENCTARYALLIYREIEPVKGMKALSDHLLAAIINKLAILQVKGDVNILRDRVLEKRAWYRFVYAWANYYMAQRLIATNCAEAGKYLAMAAQYSPDITDLGRPNDYHIDKNLLADKQGRSLPNEYLAYLKSGSDKSATRLALTEMAIRQPDLYKAELKAFYTVNPANKQTFKSYWDNAVSATLSPVPVAGIKMRDGSAFNTIKTNGKWVLLDFWGTWCAPCRAEHPDLQKLYADAQKGFAGKLNIVTVACHDTEKAVKAYMSEFKYSFPVALSDEKIGKTFNVLGYPTKVLISPQGKYVKVPFGVNWVAFVKAYAGID